MAARIIDGVCVPAKYLVMGYLQNNVYVIDDGAGTIVVDPSCHADDILGTLGDRPLDAIFVTHYHSDHTGALAELKQRTGAKVYASAEDAVYIRNPRKVGTSPVPLQDPCDVDVELADGDIIQVGNMTWKFMLTPGHSKGSGCFYCATQDERLRSVLLSGDTLFCGTTGRTDFLGGSDVDMKASLEKLSKLPDETAVLPGHERFSTIERERATTMLRWGVR